ncbi:sensor histidine kinase [Halorarius halobius]|uniref:sensor histidine kinase n=1 Tax=Halorarius halobius TaxID=2962671 RepID=UPI0020CFAD16|nr:HAMP domain-containing sensor histidine kinase [Halorarius halobius]
MPDIQLLVADEQNREALATLVGERYTAVCEPELQPCDLHLVDDRSLPQYREALVAHKREQRPVFCPVVLIRRDDTAIDVDVADPDPGPDVDPPLVDEILTAPVERIPLFRRLSNLLVRRSQTETLRERNERLEEFAGRLSHELRNPLQILDGYLELVYRRDDRAHLERCQRAVDRMDRMIESTLELARTGDVDTDLEPVSLPRVVDDSWEATASDEATLTVDTDRWVAADEDRLRRLFENLFRNAVEHAGDDVTVTVGDVDDGVYLEDDGPGIPADERDEVFDQGASGSGGTGLGLAVVEETVAAHGWKVRVTEGTEGGARFEITGIDDVDEGQNRH